MSSDSHNRLSHDDLDALLRAWHEVNADRAAAGRDALIAQLRSDQGARLSPSHEGGGQGVGEKPVIAIHARNHNILARLTSALRSPVVRAAASLALACTLIALFIPFNSNRALARQEVILVPEAGRLDALDDRGQVIGPCALKHTDVAAEISGPFSRVTVTQNYHNPYGRKIEAVYTFPLSHRAAVDRMLMTVKVEGQPDRIIEGEVKERQQARQIYESARNAGYVASLLEQERPNIFTQSVANIEPNAQVLIEISYVEMLQQRDGEFSFDFPMVVAPRYIPGWAMSSLGEPNAADARGVIEGGLPNELERREGAILLGPATFERQNFDLQGAIVQGNVEVNQTPLGPAPYLQRVFDAAVSILPPEPAYRQREDVQALYRANPNYDFNVSYADSSREFGQIAGDGLGHVNGRWFYFDPAILEFVKREEASMIDGAAAPGAAFAPNTDQVPDASRITPMPVKPPMRAGHDISLKVSINTGEFGPAIIDYKSDLHEIICTDPPTYRSLGNRINLALKDQKEIPNRDFVLRWRCMGDAIQEAVFTHADPKWIDRAKVAGTGETRVSPVDIDVGGGFFTMIVAPPARVGDADAIPRELIFVLDTSGSMQGQPIEKAKDVMRRAIDAMRPLDTFNLITFSGDTRVLWKTPRPNSDAHRAEAQSFLAQQDGSGGTEMMTAINAALAPNDAAQAPAFLTPAELADLPADGRDATVRTHLDDIEAFVMKSAVMQPSLRVRPDLALKTTSFHFPVEQMFGNPTMDLKGKWATSNGERVFEVASATRVDEKPDDLTQSMRIVMFLTDGQVGNDDAIISAVREHAKTTRVFSFGIGDSPNRYLLDGMAQAGRGEVEYVNLNNQADEAVARFTRRIACPVLRDFQITLGDGLHLIDTIPALDAIPDLWDVKPLIVHGRYSIAGTSETPVPPDAKGKITLTGKTARGEYRRELDVTLPQRAEGNPMLPALWARAKVDQMLALDDGVRRSGQVIGATADTQSSIVALGERYHIASNFTSFVAVEKTRVTVAGESVLVPVPIELPEGQSWEGNFGDETCGGFVVNLSHADAQAMADELNELIAADGGDPSVSRLGIVKDDATPRVRVIAVPNSNSVAVIGTENQLTTLRSLVTDFDRKVDFSNAPKLDLASALAGASVNKVAAQDAERLHSATIMDNYYRFGVETLDGIRSGPVEFPWQARDGFSSIDVQLGRNMVWVDQSSLLSYGGMAPAAPGGSGGGFGGGGGGGYSGGGGGGMGGGGAIFGEPAEAFGEPGDDPARLSPEEASQQLLDIVTETVNPDGWDLCGGDLATASIDNGVLNFRTLQGTPEAQQTVERARGFVAMLTASIPEVANIATIDSPPSKPFDPANDVDPPDAVAAGDAAAVDTDLPPRMLLVIYDVRDLVAEITEVDQCSEPRAVNHLMSLITELIAPEDWDSNGGDRGRIQELKGNLIITTAPESHQAIANLLSQLRVAIAARTPGAKPVDAPVFKGNDAPAPQPEHRQKPEPGDRVIEVYDIHRIVSAALAADRADHVRMIEQIIGLIQETVDPEGWRDVGGDVGSISCAADMLIIDNTPAAHAQIAGLFPFLGQAPTPKPPDAPADADQALNQATKAAHEADIALAIVQRENRLRRIIDQRLWPVAFAETNKVANASGTSAVVVLVRSIDEATLGALTAAGLRVDDRNAKMNIVVGEIGGAKLVDLALLESVRRIELVPTE